MRLLQYGLPLVAGTTVTWLLGRVLASALPVVVGSAVALVVAVVVSLLVSRLTMRLAPLAVMLQMTMIFPDHAPSRLKVARRSTSAQEIQRQLLSEQADEQQAAVTLLALVTALGQHDRHTRGHSERVRLFCDPLSKELGLSEPDSGRLRWAALIHDVGKLEVSAAVLNKPAPGQRDLASRAPASECRRTSPHSRSSSRPRTRGARPRWWWLPRRWSTCPSCVGSETGECGVEVRPATTAVAAAGGRQEGPHHRAADVGPVTVRVTEHPTGFSRATEAGASEPGAVTPSVAVTAATVAHRPDPAGHQGAVQRKAAREKAAAKRRAAHEKAAAKRRPG